MSTASRSICIVILGVLFLFTSGAAQTRPAKMDDMAVRAKVVAVGTVSQLQSEWDASKTRIQTRVTMSVDQYVKGGEVGKSLTLYVPGGEIGEVGELYSHMPVFKKGEAVVVFVEKDKQGHYRVSGGNEGKYTIERDEKSGRLLVAGRYSIEEFAGAVRKAVQTVK
jgi:hypothetical protein